jgi:D-3-phosphoglycerate dehydrogenase
MERDARRFSVALVALDGQVVPDWVGPHLASQGIDLAVAECLTGDDLAALAGDADVVWIFGGSMVVTADRLPALRRCGAIIRTGTGTDNMPVAAATAAGIVVANTPDAASDTVADHAIGLLFAVTRQIVAQDRLVRAGVWDRDRAWPNWHLRGQTLGLIGFGRIPRLVARKLRGFDLSIIAADPNVDAATMVAAGARKVDLDELLMTSAFVSIHCPLTPATRHLIGERELRRMQPTAVLINTARGPVIDEAALVQALREGWIAAAGLDVFEEEPLAPGHPLLSLDNVVLTPHIAGYSDEFYDASWRLSVDTVVDLAQGRWPRSVVNPGVTPRWRLHGEDSRTSATSRP